MLKTFLIVLALIGVVGAAGAAWAKHNGYCSGGDRMQHIADRITRKLDLNEQQQAKLKALVDTAREMRGERQAGKAQMRERVDSLLAASALDREQVLALIGERQQVFAANKERLVNAFADFSDSLNAEQRGELAQMIGKRLDGRWGHGHHRDGGK
ncbi:MAG: periplasmic heavy metal sensor [Chromatiales bacterium]|nr:periplasmic heavy metal sensor [Chromatiales bacterium]